MSSFFIILIWKANLRITYKFTNNTLYMLKKQYRITKNKEFEVVMKQGNKVYMPVLLIKQIKNDLNYSRFGIIVSNKVSKKAYQRNTIKRRIREVIRLNFKKIKSGQDVVIVISPKIITEGSILKYDKIETVLIQGFKKSRLI